MFITRFFVPFFLGIYQYLYPSFTQYDKTQSSVEEMSSLCRFIYSHPVQDQPHEDRGLLSRCRSRAILCQIYHNALHDRWFAARDLMQMSHLQHTISNSDVPTQILYNRALVQLGLCAFRQGLFV